ncbi:MAG TPA: OmpA family protein [Devosia sp.]|jgi:outer membrane protein OmpA-like peptidoglycan-associated protein|nr:OmpA family protein [Devosia sp.]
MIRDLFKWVVPGLATVLGGTTLCLAMTSADIRNDLTSRSVAAMAAGGYDWAELSLHGRDLILTGTTTDQALLDSATERLSGLYGVRSVTSDVTLAPLATPYELHARIDGEAVRLAGAVPNDATRQRLLTLADLEQGALELRSGVPDRRLWTSGAEFAIDQLQYLDQGEAVISDLTVSLTGRARSERAFRDLLIVLRAGAPNGLVLGDIDVMPALVSPYLWNASFDGQRIEVSGHVPDGSLADRYRTAEVSGAQVATGLTLGSGEPAGFAELSQGLVEQLARLEHGAASISDGQSTLHGAPATLEIAQAIVEALEPSGTIVVLEPPRIEEYWMSATRQPGGVIVFDGYAPDELTREAFSQREGADTSYLKLGRGAPERYRSGADFGLDALELMSEGRIALRDNVLTITGTARSGADYETLLAMLSEQAPQGLVLARADIVAPPADNYSWSATKDRAGVIALSGMVPNAEVAATLLDAAGTSATQTMTYASGQPNDFNTSAEIGIGLLQWLGEGSVSFDGAGWTVTGTASSAIDKAAIETDFVTRQLAASGWSMALAAPPPVISQISPYRWSATKAADGVSLMGHVPTERLKRYLAVHAGDATVDSSELAAGAPADFVAAATAGLDAVLALEEAEVAFDGSAWSLSGRAASEAERHAMLTALGTATDTTDWYIDVVAPAPEPEPEASTPYAWSATRSADGTVTLSGLVPTEPLQRFLAVRAGEDVVDQSSVNASAPEGFAGDQLAALDALAALSEGVVSFDGTTWTITGSLRDAGAATEIDASLAGASTPAENWILALVSPAPAVPELEPQIEPVAAPVAPAATDVDTDYAFSARRSADGSVVMEGQMPSDPAMRYFAAISDGNVAPVTLADGASPSFLPSAEIGLRALLQLDEGELDFTQGVWSLRGMAPDSATRDAVLAAVAADPAGVSWTTEVELAPPPPEPEPEPEPEPVSEPAPLAQPSTPLAADVSACAAPVAEFSARDSILFQSGAALIAAESDAALDELALDLAACPDAVVHIEGHTDADGDEGLNMALSVARAEAVVNALVSRGVSPARLYALGYGESAPVAENTTAEGKRLNRRIVVTVQPRQP